MIIAICTDDAEVNRVARNAAASAPAIFGAHFDIYAQNIPDLGVDEDLFIVAHGVAVGDENSPVIGSEANDFYLTARDLNSNLHIFPNGYRGNIYISACESALAGEGGTSFIEEFSAIFQQSFARSLVFGHIGAIRGALPQPGDRSWLQAAILVD